MILNILLYFLERRIDMSVVYATLILKDLRTIESVPAKLRKEVEEILKALEV